ncbi:MAG: sigma-70 family RNA polymerase sigma factor [Bacteroidota bacterium]
MGENLEDTFLGALEEHQHKLLRICSVYAKDTEDTKDLFQEVLVHIWKAMPSFKGNAALGTWMYRITLNVCLRLNTKENKSRKKILRMDGRTIHIVPNETDTEEQHEKRVQLTRLRSCIKKLNEADKAVITLYLEELPYKEIAGILGLRENTVAVKVKRIKTKLLHCINGTT